MRYLILSCSLVFPLALHAQFVVGNVPLTIKNGATLTVDGLVLQPTADLTIQNNEIQRLSTSVVVGAGNSIQRVYQFSAPLNYSGIIGINYSDAELTGNSENALNLVVSTNNVGNNWNAANGGAVNTATNYLVANVPTSSVSRITASEATPLPVNLIGFTAKKDISGIAALLAWKVAQEKNFKEYKVERSRDAKEFHLIGTVLATGNNAYDLVDEKPFEGNNYYRLKMLDLDGGYSYSHIELLNFPKASAHFTIYPNPVNDGVLNIAAIGLIPDGMVATFVDISGRIILTSNIQEPVTSVDVSRWSSGTYMVRLKNDITFKFVKK